MTLERNRDQVRFKPRLNLFVLSEKVHLLVRTVTAVQPHQIDFEIID